MSFNRFYVISPLALVAVSACRSPYVGQNPVDGAVVKGPLNNALVFLDYNDDGILDANEPFARTDQFGEYKLIATQNDYTLIAVADEQTVDTSSGAALSGITLKAPSGAEVITPTTTLMEEGNISAEEVATVLGLPDGIDPLSFNPFDVDENDADAVAAALEVEKVSQQIMTAVTSFASAAQGAGADEGDAFTAALGSVVDVVKSKVEKIDDTAATAAEKEIDFTNATDLALIKTEVSSKAAELEGVDTTVITEDFFNNTTAAIKNVNDKIQTVEDLGAESTKNIFSTMQVLKDQVKEAAENNGTIAFKDSSAVNDAADNTAPSAITLSGDRLVSANGELVVGTLATIDPNPDDTEFTYTLAGDDAEFFEFNASSGELSLKSAPNYDVKPYYEITIITKDDGDKKFSETFIIDVVPEFGTLAEPDATVVSDFEIILGQNTLFKDMKDFVELQTTPDGQLVLVELGDFANDDQSSASDGEDGPIIAFVSITERGYELRNPATNEYMGGFFTYKTDDLTYTGYEVFVDDMSILAEYEDDLIKYFSPDSEYGSGKLTYTKRDIEYFALAGSKAVDKDGITVQEMLGFNHFDENMNVLGSAGVDMAYSDAPYYIEVVGEYEPGVASNITSTAIEVSIAETMQILLETAGEELLYGEKVEDGDVINEVDEDPIVIADDEPIVIADDEPIEIADSEPVVVADDDSTVIVDPGPLVIANGDVFDVSGNKWVLIAEINGTFTLIPVKDDPISSGQLVYDDNRLPTRELSDADVELFIGNPPALNENIASNKLEFAAIKGAGSTGFINGDIYIVNSDERLLLVEESDGSYSLIPVADGAGVFSLEYDETRQDQISRDLDAAGVEAVIGSNRYLDDNILLQPSMYNEIEQASSSTPTFLGLVELPDPNGGASNISLNVATVKEFTPGAFLGELSFVDPSGGGGGVFPIYEVTSGMMMFIEDNDGDWANDQTVTPGFYAMDGANSRVYEVAQNSDGVYEFTTETAILIQSFQTYEPQKIIDNTNFTSLDDITLQPSSGDPNIVFAAESSDIFTLDGNKLFLRDDRYFEEGYGDNGILIDTSNPNSGWDLGTLTLTVEVSGDFFSTGQINLLDTGDGDYFGIESAVITDVDGFTFTPFNFNSFQPGDELGAITSTGFDFDTIGLVSGLFVEIVGNTIKLKDNAYYDVNTDTFYEIGGGFSSLSDIDKINIVASEGDLDLLSGSILYSNLVTGGQVKQIPNFAGPPVAEKIVPIDVIGYVQVEDGDDVAAIDAAAATEVAGIITAAGLSGPVSDGHIYKTSADENFLLTFEGSPGSEIFSLIPVTRADSSSPWGYDNTRLLVGSLDLAGVTSELGTAPVERDVLGTIMQSSGISTHFASDPFYNGKGLGDGDDIIITYSFVKEDATNFGDNYTSPDPNSDKIWEFTDAQKEQTREALSAFSDVANIYFHEISETDNIVGTFRFGMTDHELYGNKDAAGWAYGPGSSHLNADVWIPIYDENDPDTSAAEHDMSAGTMGGLTMLHEIGHALGLKHTFEHPVVDRSLESNTYTLMSYTPPEEGWYDSGSWAISYTPMVLDVAALQFLYGAQTHNETDTTYSWDETIPFGSTIWDSSGLDTLDFSNFTLGHDISLVDGTSSTISFPVRDYNTQTGWDVRQLPDNLTIAHGAEIENAIGGAGDDVIVGNELSNVLNGGLGNDTLTGGDEDDIFEFFTDFGDDTISDFAPGSDLLRFFDSSNTFIPANLILAEAVGDDLVLSVGDNSLTLADLDDAIFDSTFLDIT